MAKKTDTNPRGAGRPQKESVKIQVNFDKSDYDKIVEKVGAGRGMVVNAIKQFTLNGIKEPVCMSFKDAPVGARFTCKAANIKEVWIKMNSYPTGIHNDGRGLIVKWEGNKKGHQGFCSWVDEDNGIDFDTEIELVD